MGEILSEGGLEERTPQTASETDTAAIVLELLQESSEEPRLMSLHEPEAQAKNSFMLSG